MPSWEELAAMIRQRKAAMMEFERTWGAQPFHGTTRDGSPLVVSRELDPSRPEGSWRVTYFYADRETGEYLPAGHTEARTFRSALRTAVTDFGLDLSTAQHLPTTRSRTRRDAAPRRLVAVPDAVRREAERGLAWRRQFGRGGTSVGLSTARLLARGRPISVEKVRHIARYFPRHSVDARAQGWRPGEPGFPSAGRIAWALWGGTPGWRWSDRERSR